MKSIQNVSDMSSIELLNKIMEEDNYKFFDNKDGEEILGVGMYNGKVYYWQMGDGVDEEVYEIY